MLKPGTYAAGAARLWQQFSANGFTYIRPQLRVSGLWFPGGKFNHNDIMYDWATVQCELLRGSVDGKSYNISAMYIEFENNAGAEVSPPTVNRDDALSYYRNLSGLRDYLRVPLVAAVKESTNELIFPRGNKLTCFAQTTGTVGINGLEFSSTQQSRVYGGALVVTPDYADDSQDLIYCRWYYEAASQLTKLPSLQIGIDWPLTFG